MRFNLNFAPVADVDSNPNNPVIGDRSFGRDPNEVAQHVVAFIEAHQQAGVIACAKHFPGHGDTSVDSHLDLPRVEREEPDLRQLELVPFSAAVAAGVGSVMTSHVVYPAWDEDWPATLTPRITRRILRDELGYDGVVFSDDMEMKAVMGRYSVSQQAQRGTQASVDVFLCCQQPALQFEMYRELVQAQEEDSSHQDEAIDSMARVHALRERFFLDQRPFPDLSVLGNHEHVTLADQVRNRGDA
jgi:beta-N-acetylhexosaminidase